MQYDFILPNYTCEKGPILRQWGLGLQFMNLGRGTQVSPYLSLQRFMIHLGKELYMSLKFVINH